MSVSEDSYLFGEKLRCLESFQATYISNRRDDCLHFPPTLTLSLSLPPPPLPLSPPRSLSLSLRLSSSIVSIFVPPLHRPIPPFSLFVPNKLVKLRASREQMLDEPRAFTRVLVPSPTNRIGWRKTQRPT